jgi:SAM-dependent methyltransferase
MPDLGGSTGLRWDDRADFWIQQSLRQIPLNGKTVLDVGAGTGSFTCYMAKHGAKQVVALEPDLDGSGDGKGLAALARRVEGLGLTNVTWQGDTFQSYEAGNSRFDIVLLHAVINHLDEAAVAVAHEAEWARDRYRELLKKAYRMLAPGGTLIIADAARDNLFPKLGLRNPFAPTIEWTKHQNPELWTVLLQQAGFEKIRLSWATPKRLRSIGAFLNNRGAAFMLHSHFVLHANRPGSP